MSQFLYFIPNRAGADQQTIKAVGLDSVLGNCGITSCGCGAGPNGGQGVVVAANEIDGKERQVGYYEGAQTWQERGGDHGVWIGVVNGSRPGPDDLDRDEQIGGYYVLLEDSNEWIIPLARVFPEGSLLTQDMNIGLDGKIVKAILPKFRKVSKLGDKALDASLSQLGEVEGQEPTYLTEEESFAIALAALNLNYRIEGPEIRMLSPLITTKNIKVVISAFIDWPKFHDAKKKDISQSPGK